MCAKNAWLMELAKADKELVLEGLPSVELSMEVVKIVGGGDRVNTAKRLDGFPPLIWFGIF